MVALPALVVKYCRDSPSIGFADLTISRCGKSACARLLVAERSRPSGGNQDDGGSSDGREISRGLSDVSGACNHPVCSAGRGDKRSIEDPALHYRSASQYSLAVPTLSVDRVI